MNDEAQPRSSLLIKVWRYIHPRIVPALKELWKLIRGKFYAKFALALVTLGAAFISDFNIVEFISNFVREIYYDLYKPNVPAPQITSNYGVNLGVGIGLMLAGIGIFMFCFVREHSTVGDVDSEKIQRLLNKWQELHALKGVNENPMQDDIRDALGAVTEAGNLCVDSDVVKNSFFDSHGQDFVLLFKQLRDNKYYIEEHKTTSEKLLNAKAQTLFEEFRNRLETA